MSRLTRTNETQRRLSERPGRVAVSRTQATSGISASLTQVRARITTRTTMTAIRASVTSASTTGSSQSTARATTRVASRPTRVAAARTTITRASTAANTDSRVTRRSSTRQDRTSKESNASPQFALDESLPSVFTDSTNFTSNRRFSLPDTVIFCPICYMDVKKDENRQLLATGCGHMFCNICLQETFKRRAVCPFCQRPMKPEDFRELFY